MSKCGSAKAVMTDVLIAVAPFGSTAAMRVFGTGFIVLEQGTWQHLKAIVA